MPPPLRALLGSGDASFEVSSPGAALAVLADLLRLARLSPTALAAASAALTTHAATLHAAVSSHKTLISVALARVLPACTDDEFARVAQLVARLAALSLCAAHAHVERLFAAIHAAAESAPDTEDGAVAQLPAHVAAVAVLCRAVHALQVRLSCFAFFWVSVR